MALCGQEWVLAAGERAAADVPDAARRASLAAFLAEGASLAPQVMLYALRRSGFCEARGWQVAARGRELRVAPCFTPLLQRWHVLLEEEGWLECEDDCWQLAGHAPEAWALEQRIDDARHRLRQLMSWLDESSALATALLSGLEQLEEWLVAPVLLPQPLLGLDRLLQVPGILDDYFSGMVASMVPLLEAEPGDCQPWLVGCQRTLAFSRCVLPGTGAVDGTGTGAGAGAVVGTETGAGAGVVVETATGAGVGTGIGTATEARTVPGIGAGTVTGVAVDLKQSLAVQLLPGSRYAGGLFSGLLSEAAPPEVLAELRRWLKPGAPLLLLENSAARPLHWVTPAALGAQVAGNGACPFSGAADEQASQQVLEQAGYQLLASWPRAGTPMAFCGQRLLLVCVA